MYQQSFFILNKNKNTEYLPKLKYKTNVFVEKFSYLNLFLENISIHLYSNLGFKNDSIQQQYGNDYDDA